MRGGSKSFRLLLGELVDVLVEGGGGRGGALLPGDPPSEPELVELF